MSGPGSGALLCRGVLAASAGAFRPEGGGGGLALKRKATVFRQPSSVDARAHRHGPPEVCPPVRRSAPRSAR